MSELGLERCAGCGVDVDPDWDAHGVGVEWFCELCCPICEHVDDDEGTEP